MKQIQCVEMYVRIVNYVTRSSNWVENADKQLPGQNVVWTNVANNSEAWATLQDWLKYLVRLDLWGQAQIILTQLSGYDPKRRGISYEVSHRLCEWISNEAEVKFRDSPSEPQAFWLASIHVTFGRLLISDQNTTNGRGHIRRARFLLSRYSGSIEPVDFSPWTGMDLRLEEIKYDIADAEDRIAKTTALAGLARENGDLTTESIALRDILDVGPRYLKSGELETLFDRLEEVDGHLGPNLSFLIITLATEGRIASEQRRGSLLEWYNRFERRYPTSPIIRYGQPPMYPVETPKHDDYLDIPMLLFYRATGNCLLSAGMMDLKGAQKWKQEMDLFQSNLDGTLLQKLAADIDGVILPKGSWMETSSLINTTLEALTNLLQDSKRRQRLRPKDVTMIFQDNVGMAPNAVSSQISIESLQTALYGAGVSSEQFLARISAVQRCMEYDDQSSRRSSIQSLIICLYVGSISESDSMQSSIVNPCVSKSLVRYIRSCNNDVRSRWFTFRVRMELVVIRNKRGMLLGGTVDRSNLSSCHTDCLELLKECEESEHPIDLLLVASLHLEAAQWEVMLTIESSEYSQILSHLDAANDCFEQLRSELSALNSKDALTLKSQWRVMQLDNSILLEVAIQLFKREVIRANSSGDTASRATVATELWNWVQKSKGRAVNDLLGLNATNSCQMEEALKSTIGGKETLDQWTRDRQNLHEKPTHQGRRDLLALELRMQETPEAKALIELAQGKAVTAEDMNTLLVTLPEVERSKLILVDWFQNNVDNSVPSKLTMMIFRYNEVPQIFPLDSTLIAEVQTWVDTVPGSATPKWSTAWRDAQRLCGLIKPLLGATKPDDTLVLCPSGILHRFPIHALLLPPTDEAHGEEGNQAEMTLLERNTIIYTPSMSIFRRCVHARSNPSTSMSSDADRFRAAIATPLQVGGPSTRAISKFLGREAYEGSHVNAESLINLSKEADLLHFFGHVHNRDEANPLNAHLLLYTGRGRESDRNVSCDGSHDKDAMLSAEDIIDRVKLREGAHVNLIACESGVSYPAPGDDLLGLLSAIFLAGARSACTTLWPVSSNSAGEWTELLVKEWKLARRRENSRGGEAASFIDLAQCARRASLELKREEDEVGQEGCMETWAPYVFHGFWKIHDALGQVVHSPRNWYSRN